MAVNYANMRALATKLITDNGKPVTLNRTTDGAYDPTTGSTSEVSSTVIGNGVLLKFNNREIDGTAILSSDRKLLYVGEAVQVDDRYNGWRVVNFEELDPNESGVILYTCQLRK